MNRFRKMMSAALAGCMAVSALMMSAGAANTGTAAAREKVIYGSHSAQRRHGRAGAGVRIAVPRLDGAQADGCGIKHGAA